MYYDKNGEPIKAGMRLKHQDGTIEIVFAQKDELGFEENSAERVVQNIFPLKQFNLEEWEIVKD